MPRRLESTVYNILIQDREIYKESIRTASEILQDSATIATTFPYRSRFALSAQQLISLAGIEWSNTREAPSNWSARLRFGPDYQRLDVPARVFQKLCAPGGQLS